ncbi:NADH-quinone oxidoreductase subunit C/D [Candidatus Purcelliella pentastirinorum]|uniref:NADH-quinone oxidoreductase subunit D n=1 Tax=Candidatus Purcelliella pentastirinorum TaxID=472834 RepID=A0AAX3N772_9ENTR|nr:NADH-quinone oxidoreductase subunit C/D [Candidatus Purcelliella pentastirinorum]WDI78356.1 NADH-quinone oxidoreductase subunit C/D [Candidatus Purcelliella pentastirinorum]
MKKNKKDYYNNKNKIQSNNKNNILETLKKKFPNKKFILQKNLTNSITIWINRKDLIDIIYFIKKINKPYIMLYDLHGIDERLRIHRNNLPQAEFCVFYHILLIKQNKDLIFKIALKENDLKIPSLTKIFLNSNWYERETWEMFGIKFTGHPNLTNILMPKTWIGYPLRKNHPSRATELDYFILTKEKEKLEMSSLTFNPNEWGLKKINDKKQNYMFLNFGPNHPSAHGVFRIILQLSGEKIINCIPDIGYHHRGAEKIAERQTWHGYIPYTDRIEYLGGCINEMPYILAIEKIAKIKVPKRAQIIRIMLSELFRINSHLLYISTFIQDLGAITPIFLAFTDRQKIYNIIEEITGARMHPAWFRIGGVAKDLPKNWNKLLKELLIWIPKRLNMYINASLNNKIIINRSKGIAKYNQKEALSWGVTGSGLRATGINFDIRKNRPYSGYENFDFQIPIGDGTSDAYTRVILKMEELYQSLNILTQCLNYMPEGLYKAKHPLTTPPMKNKTLKHIETLIHHFLQMSWGPILPPEESLQMIEATKGINSYYLISDGNATSYRTRIRTPSFPHLQQIPSVINGSLISDLIVYLGSIDFVMSDVDR